MFSVSWIFSYLYFVSLNQQEDTDSSNTRVLTTSQKKKSWFYVFKHSFISFIECTFSLYISIKQEQFYNIIYHCSHNYHEGEIFLYSQIHVKNSPPSFLLLLFLCIIKVKMTMQNLMLSFQKSLILFFSLLNFILFIIFSVFLIAIGFVLNKLSLYYMCYCQGC